MTAPRIVRGGFTARLFRYPGPGGWTFARIPERHAIPATHPWGRTPVVATVDGTRWATSVWRDKHHGTLLPVPAKIRGTKGDGDTVCVTLEPRDATPAPQPPRRPARQRA